MADARARLGDIIGYRRDGRAIRLIGGGSEDSGHPNEGGDETTEPPAPKPGEPGEDLGDKGKAALDAERKARREAEKRAKDGEAALARLAEIEEAAKSEQQKAVDRAEKAEREAAELRMAVLRRDVAAAKGLPADLASRLTGDDQESLEADADALLDVIAAQAKKAAPPNPPPGGEGKAKPKSMAEAIAARYARN